MLLSIFSMAIPTEHYLQARMKAGPLLTEVFYRLTNVSQSNTKVKMDIYQMNERGVVGILNSLKIYDLYCPEKFATIFIKLFGIYMYKHILQVHFCSCKVGSFCFSKLFRCIFA